MWDNSDTMAAVYSETLLTLVQEYGFTQRMLAEKLGISEAYMSRLLQNPKRMERFTERFKNHPGMIELLRAAKDPVYRKKLWEEFLFHDGEVHNPTWL